jgi:GNAT superfamily N-acetyltransferase
MELMMPHIDIRRATLHDLPAIMSMIAQMDLDGGTQLSLSAAEEVFTRVSTYPNHEVYVATVETEIIGTFVLLIMHHLSHHGARSIVIEDVVVRDDWRSQGVGRTMMEYAVRRGRALGCYKLMLSSGIKRERAHAFYETLGFQKHGYSFLLTNVGPTIGEGHAREAIDANAQCCGH